MAAERRRALSQVKREMTRRFMKLYVMFRQKKLGKQEHVLPNRSNPGWAQHIEQRDGLINLKLIELEKSLNYSNEDMAISDLHTVREEHSEDDEEAMNSSLVWNQEQYANHVLKIVAEEAVLGLVQEHISKVDLVKSFLTMCILKRRY